jgi:hypothetical protein
LPFYDPKTAPNVFDVVWCKWPLRELPGQPGEVVRCVLVLDAQLMVTDAGEEFIALVVAYGTGAENVPERYRKDHLLIGRSEYKALGLHKETVFKVDLGNRRRLPWGDKYFVPQNYVRSQNIIAGSLSAQQAAEVIRCIRARGLLFPLPKI